MAGTFNTIANLPLKSVPLSTDLFELEGGGVSNSVSLANIASNMPAIVTQSVNSFGDIVSNTNITAAFFFGDGSNLTNLPVSATTWGAITGTLSDQLDLQAALDLKLGDAPSDGDQYARQNAAWSIITPAAATAWGSIIGTLSDQLDLAAKQTDMTNAAYAVAFFQGGA